MYENGEREGWKNENVDIVKEAVGKLIKISQR